MPKKNKLQLEVKPEVSVEVPVVIQEPAAEPVKEVPKPDEFLEFSEVELNGKLYKKTYNLKDGTTRLDLIK